VPEAIAFSFVAGLSLVAGLYTVFILGLVTALIGDKPGMISGATGAVVVVLAIAVTSGVIISALVFAWEHAKSPIRRDRKRTAQRCMSWTTLRIG
jgi:MFS superfamily sulfate permease-like transporter